MADSQPSRLQSVSLTGRADPSRKTFTEYMTPSDASVDSRSLAYSVQNLLPAKERDFAASTLGLAAMAMILGYAINTKLGMYNTPGMVALTIAFGLCILSVWQPAAASLGRAAAPAVRLLLALGILSQSILLIRGTPPDSQITQGIILITILGCFQAVELRGLRIPLVLIMAAAFFYIARQSITHIGDPGIDVYMFQQHGCYALLHGLNPYSFKYPNMYEANTPFYGPGVIGPDGFLTYGFPYPPLSLLLVLPAYLLGHDPRYADMAAIAISAVLMALARSGRAARWGGLAAALFLLTPRVLYVVDLSWTEPLLVFTFSLTMFCACRWRKALPIALGLFFATKQYTIFAVPLVPLLVNGPNRRRDVRDLLAGSFIVVALINFPFLVWNPRQFLRAIMLLQIVQPFRRDAMSYLVLVYENFNHVKLPFWIGFLAVLPAMVLALRRCPRTPSGFSSALTLTLFAFFAFNKQAFCNYYYFIIATACWAIAAANVLQEEVIENAPAEQIIATNA